MNGPLAGLRVLELEAIGPVPWAGMMLADMGATVLRVERPLAADMGVPRDPRYELTARGKQAMAADLKTEAGRQAVLDKVAHSDVLLEGLRPGVLERLGLGPDACWQRNPALVYGRVTGWGQDGPLASAVGHDINYLAASGALHAIGPADGPPAVPLNLIGDFGGGGMLLLVGVMAAVFEARSSGRGQIVDAAMVDGALAMLAPILGRWQAGQWHDQRASNLLDGGAHFYTTYATSDGKAVAVGAIEARFYAALIAGLGLDIQSLPPQHDQASWPAMRKRLAAIFVQHTRQHWNQVFDGTEACVTPVLSLAEAGTHPHLAARGSFVELDGVLHPAPAPRFSRTPGAIAWPPAAQRAGP
ncbi:CaiB/BaiF CoA transferase family protein [Bordetella petrii]|uniref:CaiB/BaiF CoA transferase family protein n=1 Tax=Bordetella petrii TaxID=94624 RepID=UPI001E5F4898|nr:CaiB/BaiF CoA-transferase family protein [Bordetella petrii]MCD0502827.1 CoA transferase [Bordetella petrii]